MPYRYVNTCMHLQDALVYKCILETCMACGLCMHWVWDYGQTAAAWSQFMQAKLPWIKDMQLQHVLSTVHTKHKLYGTSTLLSPDGAVPWPVTSCGGGGNGARGGMLGLTSSGQCNQMCMRKRLECCFQRMAFQVAGSHEWCLLAMPRPYWLASEISHLGLGGWPHWALQSGR